MLCYPVLSTHSSDHKHSVIQSIIPKAKENRPLVLKRDVQPRQGQIPTSAIVVHSLHPIPSQQKFNFPSFWIALAPIVQSAAISRWSRSINVMLWKHPLISATIRLILNAEKQVRPFFWSVDFHAWHSMFVIHEAEHVLLKTFGSIDNGSDVFCNVTTIWSQTLICLRLWPMRTSHCCSQVNIHITKWTPCTMWP